MEIQDHVGHVLFQVAQFAVKSTYLRLEQFNDVLVR